MDRRKSTNFHTEKKENLYEKLLQNRLGNSSFNLYNAGSAL